MPRQRLPVRLSLAQLCGRMLPPVAAHRIACRLYDWPRAGRDAFTVRSRSVTGSWLRGGIADEYGYFFAVLGHYEWRLLAVVRAVCRPGDAIVEVGANIGTETVGFADLLAPRGTVIAFEPLPQNLDLLRVNAAACPHRIVVIPKAVADAPGTMHFARPDMARNSGTGHLRWPDEQAEPTDVAVEVTTLDLELPDVRARLLVMDAEGAETRVLSGGERWIAQHRPVIVAEAHEENLRPAGSSRDELHRVLTQHDYVVHSIQGLGLRPVRLDPAAVQWNWIAFPREEAGLGARVARAIRRVGLTPPLPLLNPIARWRRYNYRS